MAHALSRAGIPRRSWPVPYDALCDRGGAALSQEKTAVASTGNRDLHLGRLAGKSEDRRYRRLRLPRARMGARAVELTVVEEKQIVIRHPEVRANGSGPKWPARLRLLWRRAPQVTAFRSCSS